MRQMKDTSECSDTEDYIDGAGITIAACKNADHIIQHARKMQELRDKIYGKILSNIQAAQERIRHTMTRNIHHPRNMVNFYSNAAYKFFYRDSVKAPRSC